MKLIISFSKRKFGGNLLINNPKPNIATLFGCILLLNLIFVTFSGAQDVAEPPDNESIQSYGDIKFVYMVRDESNPISIKEANEVTDTILENYRKEHNESSGPLIFTRQESQKDTVILAYCFRIDGQGLTSAYVGKTGENEGGKSVELIHERAEDWYKNQVLEIAEETTGEQLEHSTEVSNDDTEEGHNLPAPGILNLLVVIGIAFLVIKRV